MTFPPLRSVVGLATVLLQPNVDTDVIIRVDRMMTTDPVALARYAFEALRYRADGTENPDCPLNDPALRGAPILLGGENFGCGSSREPAVWAIAALGVRCVIAPSLGDIFVANSGQNGLLAITLPASQISHIAAHAAGRKPIAVDLEHQTVTADSLVLRFEIDQLRKTALLDGLDDLELTLRRRDAIDAWVANDRRKRPWAWTLSSTSGDTT